MHPYRRRLGTQFGASRTDGDWVHNLVHPYRRRLGTQFGASFALSLKKKCRYEEDDNHSTLYWLPPYIYLCTYIFIVNFLLSFIFGYAYLKVHIHKLSGFRIYTRAAQLTSKKDIQY